MIIEFNRENGWPDAQLDNSPHWGRPLCKDWWQDSQFGLQHQLLNQLPQGVWHQLQTALASAYTDIADQVAQHLLKQGYRGANQSIGDISYSHVSEAIGVIKTGLTGYPKLYAILQAAPLVRGLLLLLFYAFLPFALLGSRYRLRALMTGSSLLISIITWSYLWEWVQWLDEALIQALYGHRLFQYTPQAWLADGVIGLLVIIAPVFWFVVMGAFGLAIGQGAERVLMGLTGTAGAAGEAGGQVIAKGVETGVRGVMKG